ncbi:class II glutamine amidotransferase [Castellaniella caeni]|uniref:class II glutamine amidotransferase n=1 Tax=Castellaniella caeni TaxID=266123 RepID=UPI0008371E84|nr:class II glutamine amidotransferase [Castellaniella caeni]
MCQLLGMNCATPTDITFSFTGFAARGGNTDHHADGFGIAFYENRGARCFIDNTPCCQSPVAELIKRYPIKSRNVIAHIRKATQGALELENCHPFVRELWGRHWLFAHNGDLKAFEPALRGDYSPVGQTDSERAFCFMMEGLRARFGTHEPDDAALFAAVAELTAQLTRYGVFNFLLSNGRCMLAHCSTRLAYITRAWPFQVAHLVDTGTSLDFSRVTQPGDCVSVITTKPLTDNETWTPFKTGELLMFADGRRQHSEQIAIPEAIQRANRENLACA